MISSEHAKRRLGEWAAAQVRSDTRLGIGSGTTVQAFIAALQRRKIAVVCTAASSASESRARQAGLIVQALPALSELDLAVDGADAVGPNGVLIKGGGAALVRERLVIAAAQRTLILIDAGKPVGALRNVIVPVAVIPFGWTVVQRRLHELADAVDLRRVEGSPVVTDDGLYVLDAYFSLLAYPEQVHRAFKVIEGVVDTGIFVGYRTEIWASDGDQVWPIE